MTKTTIIRFMVTLALATPFLKAADDCLACHRLKTPGAVRQWEPSAHAKAGVGCADCHGHDHARMDQGKAQVDQKVCGRCHQKAGSEHESSRHGMGLHSGWGCTRALPGRTRDECRFCHKEGSERPISQVQCARFLKQSSDMGEAGCNTCHRVESSCASCHSNHDTDLRIVRDPGVCAKCHMGPDHPQWEMWQTSQHGTLFASQGAELGPTCQTCHMPKGSHDVSRGITVSSAGDPLAPEVRAAKREEMLQACTPCHAMAFARKALARGDAILEQSRALVKEAEGIIGDLADHGWLDPMPQDRPPHPTRGHALVLDNQMLYEDTSHIERLFFKMKKYDYAKTLKGAFHQNPAYTHWYGNAELKMDLVDIQAEAHRLRERGRTQPSASVETVDDKLLALKRAFERGGLSPEAYEQQKTRLLRQTGKP